MVEPLEDVPDWLGAGVAALFFASLPPFAVGNEGLYWSLPGACANASAVTVSGSATATAAASTRSTSIW